MNTTNFEISKKLQELGFKAKSDFAWRFYDYGEIVICPTYDLETILVALPSEIFKYHNGVKTMSSEMLFITKSSLFYGYEARLFWTKKEPDESLADCAARLLLMLHEKGLIKFR